MSEVKIGALCWNQYSDWPKLLAGRRPRRRPWLRHPLDVGPPVPDRRRLDRPQLRGLADDHGLGAGHAPGPDRADGRREHVPRADAHGQAGDDPRPHLGRPRDPGHRRRVVRRGARGLRARLRLRVPRAAPLAGRGAADHARDARRHRADGPRRPLPRQGHAEPAGAGPGPPADLHRRRRREGHAQAGREVRGHEQRRRRDRRGAPQGAGAARALRDRRARPGRDRAHDRASGPSSSATAATRPSGSSTRRSIGTASPTTGRTSQSGRPRTSRRSWRRTSTSGTGT